MHVFSCLLLFYGVFVIVIGVVLFVSEKNTGYIALIVMGTFMSIVATISIRNNEREPHEVVSENGVVSEIDDNTEKKISLSRTKHIKHIRSRKCVVCLVRVPTELFPECGHECVCQSCLTPQIRICPICRVPFELVVHMHRVHRRREMLTNV